MMIRMIRSSILAGKFFSTKMGKSPSLSFFARGSSQTPQINFAPCCIIRSLSGLTLSDKTKRGDEIVFAIETYKKVHSIPSGDSVKIPQKFEVPRDDPAWPSSLWGMKLGIKVNNIINKGTFSDFRSKFQEAGLDKVMTRRYETNEPESIVLAVETYIKLHNVPEGVNPSIPPKFVVPSNSLEWPEQVWGMRLGRVVQYITYRNTHPAFRDHFQKLGLYEKYLSKVEKIVLARDIYRKVYDIPEGMRLAIPLDYVVPAESLLWPRSLWGYALGHAAFNEIYDYVDENFRDKYWKPGSLEKLEEAKADKVEMVIQAVETYRSIHKIEAGARLVIPRKFKVPSGSLLWARELWGMNLGTIAGHIVQHNTFPGHQARFQQLGLVKPREGEKAERVDRIMLAVEAYRNIHKIEAGARLAIPCRFKVPSGSPLWARELWGMKLGQIVNNIICKNSFPSHQARFQQLGLVKPREGEKAERVDRIILAVETYRDIHKIEAGTRLVIPRKFKVPSGSPLWARELWGMKLGTIADTIIYKNCFRSHQARFQQLGLRRKGNE